MILVYDINYRLYSPYRTKSDISIPYSIGVSGGRVIVNGDLGVVLGVKTGFQKP